MTGDGTCEPVEGVSADTARPLGSGFKLYVLGALAPAVRTGRASWDQQLAIRDEWKSFPSGDLQNLPAGHGASPEHLRRQDDLDQRQHGGRPPDPLPDPRRIDSIIDAGIRLHPQRWKTIWFKGGSEPGVLTLNFLATTTGGRTFVVSAMVSDPKTAFDESLTAVEALALVTGPFTLASE